MKRIIGTISEKMAGKDGRPQSLFLVNDPTEYRPAAIVNGEVPETGQVELIGDFPTDFLAPHKPLPFFEFTDVCVPS